MSKTKPKKKKKPTAVKKRRKGDKDRAPESTTPGAMEVKEVLVHLLRER